MATRKREVDTHIDHTVPMKGMGRGREPERDLLTEKEMLSTNQEEK